MQLRMFEASPAWTIEDDCLITYDLSFTRGVRLTGINPRCDSDEALEEISAQLHAALCSLPDNYTVRVHSVELSAHDGYVTTYVSRFAPDSIGGYVARKKAEQCQQGLLPRRRELYAFVSTPPAASFSSTGPAALGRRASRLLAQARKLHTAAVHEASRAAEGLARGLHAAGLAAELLDADGLFSVLWRMANPLLSQRLEPPQYRKSHSLRSQLFAGGVVNHLSEFEREGELNRVVTLKVPPAAVVATQALDLQGLPFPHHLVVTLRRVGDADALRRVETNRRQGHELDRLFAKFRGESRHAAMPDHGLLQQQEDVNDVLARLNRGERLFDLAVQVWFSGETRDELEQRTELVMNRFRMVGRAEAGVEELRGRFAFLSMLPGHQSLIGERFHPFLASRAADLLPVYQAFLGAANPTTILTTHSNELVGFHPFQEGLPAWNMTIAGGTGSGKSFTARTLLTGWLGTGGRVVVVTRGREYHRYAEILAGAVCDVSFDDAGLALGPFPAPAALSKTPDGDFEHLSSILGVMASERGAELDRLRRRLIYAATQRLYQSLAPTAPAPSLCDWLVSLQSLARDEADSLPLINELARQIRFWIDGPHGHAFCRNRSANEPALSVWNLDQIRDDDTMRVVMALLSGVIARSLRSGPTVVLLDEVWALFKTPTGAALVESLYRTVRKEGSAVWTISQSISDYTALPESCRSAVLNNSPIKLFLSHRSSDLDLVTKTFKLNAREAEQLAGLSQELGHYSDILAFFGSRRQVLRLWPTGIEYWLATSDPRDRNWEEMAIREHPELSRWEILKRLARSYRHGAVHIQLNAA